MLTGYPKFMSFAKKKDRKEENFKYSVLEILVEVIVLSVSTLNWLPLGQSLGVRKIG